MGIERINVIASRRAPIDLVVIDAACRASETTHQRGSRRIADWRRTIGFGKVDATRCQGIDVGRLQEGMAGAAHVVPAQLVGHDEEDVRALHGGGYSILLVYATVRAP